MPATAQELADAASCYRCINGVNTLQAVRISILAGALATLLSEDIMTAQELINAAECYTCIPGVSDGNAVEIYLLDAVSENISGGGGGSGASYGAGSPLNVVTPSADGAIYWNTSTSPNESYQARGTTSADWVQIV